MLNFLRLFFAIIFLGFVTDVAAQDGPPDDLVQKAQLAGSALSESITSMPKGASAQDRIVALTAAIRSYEQGLGALREGLRVVERQKNALTQELKQNRKKSAALWAVLTTVSRQPEPLMFGHPDGVLANIRATNILADMMPELQKGAEVLKVKLEQLSSLIATQAGAEESLISGFNAAQTARAELSKAMSLRGALPKQKTENAQMVQNLAQSNTTLEAFTQALKAAPLSALAPVTSFASAKGHLDWPAQGHVILAPDIPDARGLRKPGLALGTTPSAIVTAPWDATLRFAGPFLKYKNLVILEPEAGYLLILGGLETVYGAVASVIKRGEVVGLMPPKNGASDKDFVFLQEVDGASDIKELYIELRHQSETLDPMSWFNAIGDENDNE
jgi:septal ring factor EnvC (AmiA/AmiB activator)